MNKNETFESSLSELEAIVQKLESGSLSLDESIEIFETAVSLVKICNKKLEKAEQKVKLLTESADGTVSDSPFSKENDET